MKSPPEPNPLLAEIAEHLARQKHLLPTLPFILLRVQETVNDQKASARDLADVILEDPALTASVLRLANSAYYLHNKAQIHTVTHAIVLLGFETIRNLALGLSVYNMLNRLPKIPHFAEIWQHSLACGVAAQILGRRLRVPIPEEAFVAGLLHDMGKLLLGHVFTERYRGIVMETQGRGTTFLEAEREHLGIGHPEVAAYLVKRWSFPEAISHALAHHHPQEPLSPETPPVTLAVILGNAVAHHLAPHTAPSGPTLSPEELLTLLNRAFPLAPEELGPLLTTIREEIHPMTGLLEEEPMRRPTETKQEQPPTRPSAGEDRLAFLLHLGTLATRMETLADAVTEVAPDLTALLGLEAVYLLARNLDYGTLEAQLAYPERAARRLEAVAVRLDRHDDLAVEALSRGTPVHTHGGGTLASDAASLPGLLGSGNLSALPIHKAGVAEAVLLLVRAAARPSLTPEDESLLALTALSLGAVLTCGRGKSGTPAPKKDSRESPTRSFPTPDLPEWRA